MQHSINILSMHQLTKIFCILSFILFGRPFISAQNTLKSTDINQLPKERVYLHYNTDKLIPGEYLYYKLYCLDANEQTPSDVSRIAYVALIDSNGTSIFTHKIFLEHGEGSGDFFIPTEIKTDTYTLVAYTQWMRNFQSHFAGTLKIINPQTISSTRIGVDEPLKVITRQDNVSKEIQLSFDTERYQKRQLATLEINSKNIDLSEGHYSISIRKTDPFENSAAISTRQFSKEPTTFSYANNESLLLPEVRGELISGTVKTIENTPITDATVGLSVQGEQPVVQIVTTDKNGAFNFILSSKINQKAYVQLLEEDTKAKITLSTHEPLKMNTSSKNFSVSNEEIKELSTKFIHHQIENSYASVKKDSLIATKNTDFILQKLAKHYVLNDFTKFPTLKEVMVEIIEDAWVASRKEKDEFRARVNNTNASRYTTLVLLDGLIVKDHSSLLDVHPKNIKSIGVINERYVYGTKIYDGVLMFRSYTHQLIPPTILKDVQEFQLPKKNPNKQYYSQTYKGDIDFSRIPDFRYQLLWNPTLSLNAKSTKIPFYTSDITGTFEVRIEGFTNTGKPISLRKTFTVE